MTAIRPLPFLVMLMRPGLDVVAAALGIFAFSAYDAFVSAWRFDECYALALMFQMFIASTGLRDRAIRGHFDPLFVSEPRRIRIAAFHWAVSIAPGIAVWLAVVLVDIAVRGTPDPRGLTAPGIVALMYVSTVAWAGTLLLPRYTGGVAWFVALVAVAGMGGLGKLSLALSADPSLQRLPGRLGAALVAPMLLLRPASADALLLAIVAITTAAVWLIGAAIISGVDVELTELS